MRKVLFLLVAVGPTVGLLLFVAGLFLYAPNRALAMNKVLWGLAAIQAVPVVIFTVHALLNKEVKSAEIFGWFARFAGLIPFGMYDYWKRFIWAEPRDRRE